MTREALERNQVLVYLAAALLGLLAGSAFPAGVDVRPGLVSPPVCYES
ncbi:MAG: hypothetical protein AB1578_23510 [Thermodesulfobacteriota bacterium]